MYLFKSVPYFLCKMKEYNSKNDSLFHDTDKPGNNASVIFTPIRIGGIIRI